VLTNAFSIEFDGSPVNECDFSLMQFPRAFGVYSIDGSACSSGHIGCIFQERSGLSLPLCHGDRNIDCAAVVLCVQFDGFIYLTWISGQLAMIVILFVSSTIS
jgi:hypothetical protein